eukprot:2796373-Pleurochrysis_carterae.AAC.2
MQLSTIRAKASLDEPQPGEPVACTGQAISTSICRRKSVFICASRHAATNTYKYNAACFCLMYHTAFTAGKMTPIPPASTCPWVARTCTILWKIAMR